MLGLKRVTLIANRATQGRRGVGKSPSVYHKRSVIRRALGERLEDRRMLAAYVVDTSIDAIDANDGFVSLREAVQAANTNMVVGDAGAGDLDVTDTITFADGLSTITLNSQLSITQSLDISLGGATAVTLSGDNLSRIFSIDAGSDGSPPTDVSVSGLTLTDGSAESGGAIYVSADQSLMLDAVTLTGNVATGNDVGQGGGAIFNAGALDISGGRINDNEATGTSGSGGGILNMGGTLAVTAATISGNTAHRAGGGIETAGGNVTLTDVILGSDGDGTDDESEGNSVAVNPTPGNGGGLHIGGAGVVTVTGGSVIGNSAVEGGGLWNSGAGTLTVNDVTVSGNTASGDAADNGGGGIYNDGGVTILSGGVVSDNVADGTSGSGGGVLNNGGTLTISDGTIISGNRANRAGGGIETVSGSATLDSVIIRDNTVNTEGATGNPGNGGGLHIGGDGVVMINGGEVTGNSAVEGGGLWNSGAGTLMVDGTTIADNTAVRGGGVYQQEAATTQTFTVDLQTLNGDYGSNATGTATITLDTSGVTGPNSGTATIRVQINATGLPDLTDVTGGIHVAHIHGQFAGNTDRPSADQGDGPFFDGEGGAANGFAPSNSTTPTTDDDGASNIDESAQFGQTTDFLDFFEGRPDYGPVVLNLSANQLPSAPDGTPPLTFFFEQLAAGNIDPAAEFPVGTTFDRDTTYSFDLSDADARRQYNNLTPLNTREIVLHGLVIPKEISDAIDAATGAAVGSPTAGVDQGDGTAFRRTAPIAAGSLVVASGMTTITNATITGNTATGDLATEGGGGIYNEGGTLSVSSSTIASNAASGTLGSGGGIFSLDGEVSLNATTIGGVLGSSGNTANRAGGGIEVVEGTVSLEGFGSLSNNFAGINGGGLHITGGATVNSAQTTYTDNIASSEGGGLWNSATGTINIDGGIISGNVASGNDADNGGGGIFNDGGLVTTFGGVISDNVADGTSGSGGGVLNDGGTLEFGNGTIISGNRANRAGGGIETAGGTVTLDDAQIRGNTVNTEGATGNPGNGGGLHIGGTAVVMINGGEFSNNSAVRGGGVWNSGAGTLNIDGTMIADNTAQSGGGVYQDETSTTKTFTVDLQTLNAAYGSTAIGTATITLDTSAVTGSNSGTATIRVQVNATGLPDLTNVSGGIHVAHIHGQFAGNTARPSADQGDGPFFDGEGGAANGFASTPSTTPTTADDGAKNIDESARFGQTADFLDFFEGRPDYGPVVLNLSANQLASAPDGTPPLTFFFQQLAAGNVDPAAEFPVGTTFTRDTTYTFDLSDADARRQYNNLTPLNTREIVLHGLVIPKEISDVIDAATGAAPGSPTAGVDQGDGTSFRPTAPIAAGTIVAAGGSTYITDATITGNTATGGPAIMGGGGLYSNKGDLQISDSMITDNHATGEVGGGGGIFNFGGSLAVSGSTISGNTAIRAGGGIETAGGTVTLDEVTLGSDADGVDDDLEGNSVAEMYANPGNGGGLHIGGEAVVSISDSSVVGNAAVQGGGLWNNHLGTLIVNSSTIAANTAIHGSGMYHSGNSGDITLTNSTIAGNTATGNGGGLANEGANVTLTSVTIAANMAAAGGGIYSEGGKVEAISTIIASNTGVGSDIFGRSLYSNGNNLIGNTAWTTLVGVSSTDILNVDAGLATLADNGGATQTIALLASSPALNAGALAGLAVDQRGIARPQGSGVDIRAFESDLDPPATPTLAIAAANADQNEGNSGVIPFTFTVTRSDVTTGATSVNYVVSGSGTNAASADDFQNGAFPNGTVSFADGETSKTITVNVAGDVVFENDETFVVTLSGATDGASIGMDAATGTIRNDDAAAVPTLSIVATNADRLEGNSGTTPFTFTIMRGGTHRQRSRLNTPSRDREQTQPTPTTLPAVFPLAQLTWQPVKRHKH